ETPGGTILYEAHKALEQICIERDTLHYKQQVALRYAELVYYGQWFHPLREALQTFIDHTNATVTGTAKVRLYKGKAQPIGAASPRTPSENSGQCCAPTNWAVSTSADKCQSPVTSSTSSARKRTSAWKPTAVSTRRMALDDTTTIETLPWRPLACGCCGFPMS